MRLLQEVVFHEGRGALAHRVDTPAAAAPRVRVRARVPHARAPAPPRLRRAPAPAAAARQDLPALREDVRRECRSINFILFTF